MVREEDESSKRSREQLDEEPEATARKLRGII